jgi:hypothetical protein
MVVLIIKKNVDENLYDTVSSGLLNTSWGLMDSEASINMNS